jgi:uracil-DNA glycosylase
MECVALRPGADLDGFRQAVRSLAVRKVPPNEVAWTVDESPALFGRDALPSPQSGEESAPLSLPRSVHDLISALVCHRDPERYALLYELIWRVGHGERALPVIPSDPLVHRLDAMRKAINRDLHKMHAFLRFRRLEAEGHERFVAWFEPEHFILEATAPFFVERFRSLHWSILTPIGSLHWDRQILAVGPPGRREDAPESDGFEAGWRGYYESMFNPARANPKAMRAEMPKKYWRNMPETGAIPELIRSAPQRVTAMIEKEATMPLKREPQAALRAMTDQEPKSLEELNDLIRRSEPLVPGATQAVVGEGPETAAVMFVGEQPGDQEDLQGRPFVGPAGQLLNRALAEVGLNRSDVYLTNAVKHFKFEQRGKRRIHQKPTAGEVKHYRWWLEKELQLVGPRLVVALGSTAVLALAGKALPVIRARGRAQFGSYDGFITVHPSYLLRLPDEETKRRAFDEFCADLAQVRDLSLSGDDGGALPLAAAE